MIEKMGWLENGRKALQKINRIILLYGGEQQIRNYLNLVYVLVCRLIRALSNPGEYYRNQL